MPPFPSAPLGLSHALTLLHTLVVIPCFRTDGRSQALELAGIGVGVALLLLCWLRNPPTSGCAFCGPFWLVTYSWPLALIYGQEKASRALLAFTPPPDLPLQFPLLALAEVTNGECCLPCCNNDDDLMF